MNIFLRCKMNVKIKSVYLYFVYGLLEIFLSCRWKNQIKVLLAFMKLLSNFENPFRNPLPKPFSCDTRILTGSHLCDPEIVPGAGYGTYSENRPKADKQRQKSTNGREETLDRDSDASSGTLFRIS